MIGYLRKTIQNTVELFDFDAPLPVSPEMVSWIIQKDRSERNESILQMMRMGGLYI
jgi:hypothetical protein